MIATDTTRRNWEAGQTVSDVQVDCIYWLCYLSHRFRDKTGSVGSDLEMLYPSMGFAKP